jgi:hypothetical protein
MSVSSRLSPFSEATPTEMVTWTDGPPSGSVPTGTDRAAMCVRSRSAMLSASVSRACGSRMANSSPPNRPARS